MWTAGFPEPKTFSQARRPAAGASASTSSTSCTTTRCSATACSTSREMGFPLITTIHHPITFDRRIDIEAATTRRKKLSLRRWYGFVKMQGKVARSVGKILTVSESSRRDIVSDFGVDPADLQVIPLGVDEVFRPPTEAAGARPHRGDGQRRRTDEGHRDAARGVRQAAHRARRRAGAGHQAEARRPHRAADRPAGHRRARLVRQRHQRRRAGRGDGLRRGGLRALALRGLLAADRRADGLRDPAGGQPRRCDPRGGRRRRRVRRPGHPG